MKQSSRLSPLYYTRKLFLALRLHTYIIGHYKPSVRVIDLVSYTTYVVCVNNSLKSTPNDRFFWETFHSNFILYYVPADIRLFEYNILSVQTHIICNIFLTAGKIKTVNSFNNIAFILVAKISSRKVYEKMENKSTLEQILLVLNRNACFCSW